MQYAIIQGVEVEDGDSVHLFAVDSREHDVEFFLRTSDFLPSESDAEALRSTASLCLDGTGRAEAVAGVLTPRVCVAVGSEVEVEAFDDQVRQVIQRLFGLIASDRLPAFGRELRGFDASFAQSERVSDELVLALVVRATFPSPDEARYPCSMRSMKDEQGLWAFWTVVSPEEEQRTRPQINRLLSAWLARRSETYG